MEVERGEVVKACGGCILLMDLARWSKMVTKAWHNEREGLWIRGECQSWQVLMLMSHFQMKRWSHIPPGLGGSLALCTTTIMLRSAGDLATLGHYWRTTEIFHDLIGQAEFPKSGATCCMKDLDAFRQIWVIERLWAIYCDLQISTEHQHFPASFFRSKLTFNTDLILEENRLRKSDLEIEGCDGENLGFDNCQVVSAAWAAFPLHVPGICLMF